MKDGPKKIQHNSGPKAQTKKTLGDERLCRRADKRYGSDDALASKQHRVINRRFTRIHRNSQTHTITTANVFNSSKPKGGENQSTVRDLIRNHSSQTPRGRLHAKPSPLTMVELRSSSDVVATNPTQTQSKKTKRKKTRLTLKRN